MAENSTKFELLAIRVAGGESVRHAAAELKLSERQAYRLSGSQEFRQRISELQTAVVRQALGELATSTTSAASRLSQLVQSDDEAIALRACSVLLDRYAKLNDIIDIRHRIEDLESRTNETQN